MNNQNSMAQLRYLEEMTIDLKRAGFEVGRIEDQHLPVSWNGSYLCRISGKGSVLYRQEIVDALGAQAELDQVVDIANITREYMTMMEYRTFRKGYLATEERYSILLDHLEGTEITTTGHLSAQNFTFGDEIIENDGKLNFYVQAEFDVDAAFGTFVCTDKNDDWLNIYANYDMERGEVCDTLELTLCKGDGSEETVSYHLNAAEQEVLLRRMDEFCQQQTGMSLHDYTKQLREEQTQTPEMQM